ncbi:Pr6Pr family membrane protein [Aquiluna sp.]|nr:Pr6Pr family membrane protein [Aquiluna sp.]MDA9010362.1 Pr6Pr family membrane protein [Aquiluna sp.]
MLTKGVFGALRTLLGLALVGSVIWQVTDRIRVDLFRPTEYFAYFSITSAIFAGVVLLVSGLVLLRGKSESERLNIIRLIAVVSMIIVGVVYHALLGDSALDPRDYGYDWPRVPNAIIHTYAPILIVVDYLISLKGPRPKLRNALWVVVYPLAWLGLSIIRGLSDGWWPYWFINPGSEGGVVGMLTYIAVIAAAFIVLGFIVLGLRLALAKLFRVSSE